MNAVEVTHGWIQLGASDLQSQSGADFEIPRPSDAAFSLSYSCTRYYFDFSHTHALCQYSSHKWIFLHVYLGWVHVL